MATPTAAQLKRAIAVAEQIERLQAELNSILGGSGNASTAGAKRGRKPGTQTTADTSSVAPKKRGRKPGSKNLIKAADDAAGSVKPEGRKAKRIMSPEAREKIAAAQRKRWAAQKKAAK